MIIYLQVGIGSKLNLQDSTTIPWSILFYISDDFVIEAKTLLHFLLSGKASLVEEAIICFLAIKSLVNCFNFGSNYLDIF